MKKLLNYFKVSMSLLLISSFLLTTGTTTVRAEEAVQETIIPEVEVKPETTNTVPETSPETAVPVPEVEPEATEPVPEVNSETPIQDDNTKLDVARLAQDTRRLTANIDIVNGREVRMLRTSTGVVVDGHQLNHDYVKILNINSGSIVINDENYTQNGVNEPWSSQEDAYVIKGKGTSANTVTLSPTSNEITIYLVDLEWNGQIIVGGNGTNVNIVVCGDNKNFNTKSFIYVERFTGSLFVTGLSGKEDNITTNTFLLHYFHNPNVLSRKVDLKNFTINSNCFYTAYSTYYPFSSCVDGILNFDNVALNNSSNLNIKYFATINVLNSEIKNLDIFGSYLNTNNSYVNFICPVTGVLKSTNSTLSLNSGTASSFSNISLENSSIYSAVNFVGTPVNNAADDLYVKKIRLRQHPNTYVSISIDNGTEARLRTDANGYLYPYVKTGTTRVDAKLDDGQTFYATFPATSGTDNTTTNLQQAIASMPVITDTSTLQKVTVGRVLSLFVNATPGTAGHSLSYQWYKNDTLLAGETHKTLTRSEAVTNDSGFYKCTVKEDGGGTVTSSNIEVIVSRPESESIPSILSQTSDMDLIAGSGVTLIVNAAPSVYTNSLSYQWYHNNTAISNSTDNKLTLSNIKLNQAGNYKCVVTEENLNTTVESGIVNISVR